MASIDIKNLSARHRVVADSPRVILDRHFNEMGAYGAAVGWELEFRQLDAGELNARAAVIASPNMTTIRVELNRGFHQQGISPDGVLTFGLPDRSCEAFNWCGADAQGGDLLNFNMRSGFDGASRAGFSGVTLSFQENLLQRYARIIGLGDDILEKSREKSLWYGAPTELGKLRSWFRSIYNQASLCPGEEVPQAGSLFNTHAAVTILNVLAGRQGQSATSKYSLRNKAVNRALELIDEQDRLPLTVADLCDYAGVSAPTLYRGFMDRFGVSTKKYLTSLMLDGARKELQHSTQPVKVQDVAIRWGFWHMGQFAADYRRQFGERPLETLQGRK